MNSYDAYSITFQRIDTEKYAWRILTNIVPLIQNCVRLHIACFVTYMTQQPHCIHVFETAYVDFSLRN